MESNSGFANNVDINMLTNVSCEIPPDKQMYT